VHRFGGPEVGGVGDTAGLVGGDGLALHHPFEGGLAVDDGVVGFQRDVAERDEGIVDDGGFVGDVLAGVRALASAGFHVAAITGRRINRIRLLDVKPRMACHRLIIQIPMRHIAVALEGLLRQPRHGILKPIRRLRRPLLLPTADQADEGGEEGAVFDGGHVSAKIFTPSGIAAR